MDNEKLFIYLAITEHVPSAALVREEEGIQHPINYISKHLIGAKSRYPRIEKLANYLVKHQGRLEAYPHDRQQSIMDDLISQYLEQFILPTDWNEAKKVMIKAARFIILDGVMYKRRYSMPLLRCVAKEEVKLLMVEVHKGICRNHGGGANSLKEDIEERRFLIDSD
uniref:Uncharacterized protein n=1 Tax=Cannabis sativa TaxID=3483 RepID=A0A803Q195_CANSA